MRKPSIKTLRNKCDSLLSPIIIKLYPRCLLCNSPTQVAHHFCHKSKSSRLRYDIENLIPLCASCHFALHQNESMYSGKIIEIKGMDWYKKIELWKNEIVKTDLLFYNTHYEKLQRLLQD